MHRLLATAALALLAAAAGAQAPAQPIVIKFSHVVAPDTPKGQAIERFRKLAEERTHGRVKVEVYANSQLYKDKEEMEALQLGSVQMLAPSLSKFGPMGVKKFELFDLPFMFSDEAAFDKVVRGPVGEALFKQLEPRGIKGLAYWTAGFHVMSANRPLHVPADVKGLKMRIPSSKVLAANEQALGAIPQVMTFAETYQALQTGVVDGTENILSSYTTQKYYEVQKDITLTYHTHTGYAVIANRAFWDKLPPDIQAALSQALREASDYEASLVQKDNQDALAFLRSSPKVKVFELTPAEREQWRAALLPVHKEAAARIGQDTIEAAYQATGFSAPR